MTLSFRHSLLFSVLILLLVTGCIKKETYPDIPQISLNNFSLVFDSGFYAKKGILSVSFTDGNGDIGLSEGDTNAPFTKGGPYYYNFVITYSEKQNGVYTPVSLNPPFSGRIPLLSPNYPGKAIKGVIVDTLPLNPMPVFDTVRFDVFLYDRALNKSNTLSIPEIILRRQ